MCNKEDNVRYEWRMVSSWGGFIHDSPIAFGLRKEHIDIAESICREHGIDYLWRLVNTVASKAAQSSTKQTP